VELFFSILILATGITGAWFYLRKPPIDRSASWPHSTQEKVAEKTGSHPRIEGQHGPANGPPVDSRPRSDHSSGAHRRAVRDLSGDRPWRKLGAVIMLLLAVMFVLGIYVLDEHRGVWFYALYWLIMMMLVLWLCVLAVRDVVYTRQLIIRWRNEHEQERRRVLELASRASTEDAS
jgi:uncharacterized membrane protein